MAENIPTAEVNCIYYEVRTNEMFKRKPVPLQSQRLAGK